MIIKYNFSNDKKGSITVFALLIMSIIMISATYLIYITKLQSLITVSSANKIQSYYLAESKINKVFYEDKYYLNSIYPVIKGKLQNSVIASYKVILDPIDLEKDDNESTVKVSFTKYNSKSKRNIVLETKSIYKGIETSIKAYGPLVDDIYESDMPILDKNNCPRIDDIIDYIGNNISVDESSTGPDYKVVQTFDNDRIVITNEKVKLFRNDIEIDGGKLKAKNIFIVKNKLNKPITFQIGDNDNEGKMKFEALLYIDGDLYINSNMDFKGIIIVNGNIYINPHIHNDSGISGIILTNGTIDDNSFVSYERAYIYRYGVYIPRFIQPRLETYIKV